MVKKLLKTVFSRRFLFRASLISILLVFLIILGSNYRVESVSEPYVSSTIEDLPTVKVGLIPGTIKTLRNGVPNRYFSYRIEAAVKLYNSGKIRHFLISGDNGTKDYNEPEDMLQSLLDAGIPRSAITLDYAGFDTYDSMIRAKKVFGQDQFIVISQRFQNERAVYIARRFDIEAYGYNAKDVTAYGGFRTKAREYLARVKAVIEVTFNVQPTFLGEKVVIP